MRWDLVGPYLTDRTRRGRSQACDSVTTLCRLDVSSLA
jgi:hypothetical protein